jgi:hypothetical protein
LTRDSWPISALPSATLLSHVSSDIPQHIAAHCLQLYSTGTELRALDVTRVTQFFARQVLRQKVSPTVRTHV